MPETIALKDNEIVYPVITVDDYSDKEAVLTYLGAFIIDEDQVDATATKIKEAFVKHDKLSEEISEREGNYTNVPDVFEYIRDTCGLTEFPRCGWLFLEERYLLNRGND